MSRTCHASVLFYVCALLASACPGETPDSAAPATVDGGAGSGTTSENQVSGAAGSKASPAGGSGAAGSGGTASAPRAGGGSDDDAGVGDDSCPPNIAVPTICHICDDGTCGAPTCKDGMLTGKHRCPSAPPKADPCSKTGKPVCGSDGKAYDAAGGAACVPVAIACQGSCPCSVAAARCITGGCSNQLCTDATSGPVVSTCEWREEYACYRSATCERQPSGQCGWTQTPELMMCLQEAAAP